MNTRLDTPQSEKRSNRAASIFKVARALAIFPGVMVVVLFLAAGRLDWTWAWVFLGINLANAMIAGPITLRNNPPTLAERGPQGPEQWDLGSIFFLLVMCIALPLVAGLGARFGWAGGLRLAWHVAGACLLAVGLGLVSWVGITNPHVWSDETIRPGQAVYTGGPYRFVRHPAYAGMILQALGVPALLGSLWALIPGILAAVLTVVATSQEDRTLQAELPGYEDYAQAVPSRLVPGIW
jgi:protein-S-isoprenylcysteine O-methyltransferase Ste14